MVDPTSDLDENVGEHEVPSCDDCEGTIGSTSDQRVITRIDYGIVQTAHFCDDDRRGNWDDEA